MRECEALAVREIVPRAACNFRCCPPSDKPCTRYPHVARRRAKSACMFRRLLCCFLLVLPTFCGTTPRAPSVHFVRSQAIGRDARDLVQPNRAALAVARASKARSVTHHGRRCIQKGGRANRQGADKEDAVCGGGHWWVVTETEGLGRASKDTDATPPRRIYRRGALPQVRRLCCHRVDTDDAEVGGGDHGAARGARGAPAVRAPAKGADDAYAPRISRTHARARTHSPAGRTSLQPPPFFFIRSSPDR